MLGATNASSLTTPLNIYIYDIANYLWVEAFNRCECGLWSDISFRKWRSFVVNLCNDTKYWVNKLSVDESRFLMNHCHFPRCWRDFPPFQLTTSLPSSYSTLLLSVAPCYIFNNIINKIQCNYLQSIYDYGIIQWHKCRVLYKSIEACLNWVFYDLNGTFWTSFRYICSWHICTLR